MAKKSKNSKLLVHYTRTMTPKNLSRAANYVGGYVLKGLGALGKIFTAPLTGGPLGPATVVLPKTKKLLDAERKLRKTQEELIGKAMTWVSPLNYGAALMTGNGLNAKKGEEEVASWSPAWLAAARLGELYVGPKAVKGVKATPRVVVNTAAKAGVKPAKVAVVAREINKGVKENKPNVSNRTVSTDRTVNGITGLPDILYTLYNEFGEPIGQTNIGGATLGIVNRASKTSNRMIDGIYSKNKAHKVSEDTYNVAIEDILNNGGIGLESGWSLMSPLKTMAVTSKFPYTVIGQEFGNPVRLLTGNTKRAIPQRVLGNHYLEIKPKTEIKFNEVTGEFEEIPIEEFVLEPSTSLKFFERKPSKLTEAEKRGITKGERNLPKPSFRSELNWFPEDWFEKTAGRKYKDGSLTQYTDKDIKELNSHIPEYLEIEARSKKNGTWLKMEDGSNWYGDPRSWVLMLSKNLKLHNPEDFWTGIHNSDNFLETNLINPEYNGKIWGVYGQKLLSAAKARTYAPNDNLVFHMVSSKKTPTVVYDALGKPWYDIGGLKVGDQYITGKTTDEIINDNFSKGIGRVKINNVSDTGPNKIKTNSKYSTGDFMLDWETFNSPGVHQNDIILSTGSFRKSLLGNNGAFNYKNKNIYRGLIPLAGGYTLYNLFNQPLQQLQYLKQGGKMNVIELFKRGGQVRKMQTASGGPIVKLPGKSQKEVDETNNYNRNKAKGLFKGIISGKVLPTMSNIGSMLEAAYNGWLDTETTDVTGDVPNPGMRNPTNIVKGVQTAATVAKKAPSLILSYFKVVPRFINKVKKFNGADKVGRTISAATKLINPNYTKTLAKSPELVDHINLYNFKEFNTKQLQDFLKVWSSEASKAPFSLDGMLQYDTTPDKIKNLPKHFEEARKILKGIDLGKRYGRVISRKYQQMYDLITDPILRHVADTSPQYIPELFLQQKQFGGATEEFMKSLIKRSNSYRRFMTKSGTAEDFKTFKGSGIIKGEGSQINVEGKVRSDFNGEYGSYPGYYEGLPNLKGDISTWWDLRVPLGVDVKEGIWTENPTINKFRAKFYKEYSDNGSSAAERAFWENYSAPRKFIDWPTHQVFFGPEGSLLLGFKVTTEMPKGFTFGKGYKQGGKINIIEQFKKRKSY